MFLILLIWHSINGPQAEILSVIYKDSRFCIVELA